MTERRRRWRVRLIWLAVAVVVLAIGATIWLAAMAPRLIESEAERMLSEKLGSTVTVEEISIGWLPPTVTAIGVQLVPDGAQAPLATVERVVLESRWRELFGAPRRIHSVRVEKPIVELTIDEEGRSNLPDIEAGEGGVGVAIDAVEVAGGTVVFEERRLPLNLLLRQLRLRGSGSSTDRFVGSVEASDVVVDLPTGATYAGAVALRASLADRRLELHGGRVSGPELQAAVRGGFLDLPTRSWRVDLEASGSAGLLGRLGLDPGELETDWRFGGKLEGETSAWKLTGELTANRVAWQPFVLTGISSDLTIDSRRIGFDSLRGRLAGGSLSGSAEIDLSRPETPGSVRYRVEGGDLARLTAMLGLELPSLDGRWRIDGDYSFVAAEAREGTGRASAFLDLSTVGETLTWRRDVEIAIRRGVLEFGTRGTEFEGERLATTGRYSLVTRRGAIDYRLATDRIGAWLDLLLDPSEDLARWLPREGRSNLVGTLNIDGDLWSSRLEIDHFDGRIGELDVGRLGGALTVSPSGVRDLRLDLAGAGEAIGVTGSLLTVATAEAPAVDLRVSVESWPARQLLAQLGVDADLDGRVVGAADLYGTTEALGADAELSLADASVYGVPFQSVSGRLVLGDGRLTFEELSAAVAEGGLSGSGWLSLDGAEADFLLSVAAVDLASEDLEGLVPVDVRGLASGRVVWRGTVERPEIDLEFASENLELGPITASADTPAGLSIRLADGEATVEAEIRGLLAISGGGVVDGARSDIALAIESASLGPLLDGVVPFDIGGLGVAVRGEVRLTGDLLGGELAPAIRLPKLDLEYEGRRLEAIEPVEAQWREGGFDVRSLFLGQPGTASEVFVFGRLPIVADEPLDLDAQLSVDSSWLQLLMPEWTISGGTIDALASVGGSLSEPLVNGQGELRQESVRIPGLPHALQNGRVAVLFYPGQVVVDESRFGFAGGTLRAAGSLTLYGDEGLQYRMQLAGERIQLRVPEGWQIRGDTELTVTSEPGGRQIRGRIDVDRAHYSADVPVGLMQLLQRAFARTPVLVEESDELLTTTQLNVIVQGERALRVRNNVADLRGDIDLVARGNLARPVIFGEVKVDSGGTLLYAGNEYVVQRAELNFVNPYRIQPVVDLEATTRLREYDLSLNLSGTLDRLDVAFSSNPPLPDLDVLSLLTGGEASTVDGELSGEDEGDFGAQAFLYGQAASAVASRVNRLFGLDRFRIDPLTGESGSLTSARVTVGKRLSSDVFATYSYDPSQSAQQILQIEWQVSRLLTLVATQNGDGTYSVDARWERTF